MNERATQEQKDALTKEVNVEAIEGDDKNRVTFAQHTIYTCSRCGFNYCLLNKTQVC